MLPTISLMHDTVFTIIVPSRMSTIMIMAIIIGVIASAVILRNNLYDGHSAFVAQIVTFTCTIHGNGTILTWTSDEYIGPGDVLEFASIDIPGRTETSSTHPTTVATLINTTIDTNTGVTEIVSELHIKASLQYETTQSVSCRINSHGTPKTIKFRNGNA